MGDGDIVATITSETWMRLQALHIPDLQIRVEAAASAGGQAGLDALVASLLAEAES